MVELCFELPLVLRYCWLDELKDIQPETIDYYSLPKTVFWKKWRKKTAGELAS